MQGRALQLRACLQVHQLIVQRLINDSRPSTSHARDKRNYALLSHTIIIIDRFVHRLYIIDKCSHVRCHGPLSTDPPNSPSNPTTLANSIYCKTCCTTTLPPGFSILGSRFAVLNSRFLIAPNGTTTMYAHDHMQTSIGSSTHTIVTNSLPIYHLHQIMGNDNFESI